MNLKISLSLIFLFFPAFIAAVPERVGLLTPLPKGVQCAVKYDATLNKMFFKERTNSNNIRLTIYPPDYLTEDKILNWYLHILQQPDPLLNHQTSIERLNEKLKVFGRFVKPNFLLNCSTDNRSTFFKAICKLPDDGTHRIFSQFSQVELLLIWQWLTTQIAAIV
jgi:hypothetical protein